MLRPAAFALAFLGLAAAAHAETKAPAQTRVRYACEGNVALVVTYPAAAAAATKPVKLIWNDTTYFLRPAKSASGALYANKRIKLEWHTKGDEGVLSKEGKPVADKCKKAPTSA